MTPAPFTQPITPLLAFDMIFVKGGPFRMGSDKASDPDADDDEMPPHDVTVPDFYLGQYPVTQDLWLALMGENPSFFSGERRPVERVSWDEIVKGDPENQKRAFLDVLNEKTGRKYRLPSEAEWEYAARGGLDNKGFKFAGSDKLKEVGWFSDNSHGETKPLGLKAPNALGLYDMSGNVWEWCEDDWHGNYDKASKDGSAWIDHPRGSDRVNRGGSWDPYFLGALDCRSAFRRNWPPGARINYVGFRLALSLQ